MEQPSCIREFSRYTVLSVLGTLGVSCYILADTFFISKGLGTSGLAALNIAIPVYNFVFNRIYVARFFLSKTVGFCVRCRYDDTGNDNYLFTVAVAFFSGFYFE